MTTAVRFFALVSANPAIADMLARVMGHAPLLAGKLARRAELLDVLIGADLSDLAEADAYRAQISARVARAADLETALDEVRRWSGEQRFRTGVALVEGLVDPAAASRSYSDIADAALSALMPRVRAELVERHGDIEGFVPVVLAMGRYGGRALTEQSDLDLVFLYSAEGSTAENGESGGGGADGGAPLGQTIWANRLFQRYVSALTVPTAVGPLYEVDTRLRPSGAQGLLAVSIRTFRQYQEESAWTWEHMALTRAPSGGGRRGGGGGRCRHPRGARSRPRDAGIRCAGGRRRCAPTWTRAHPQAGPLDVKRGKGGLIDLEFDRPLPAIAATGAHLDPRPAPAIAGLVAGGPLGARNGGRA